MVIWEKMKLIAVTLFGATAVFAAAAMAQPPAAPARPTQTASPQANALHDAVLKNLAADQKKFCDGKEGKEGHDCMAANLSKASKECQAAIANMSRAPQQPSKSAG